MTRKMTIDAETAKRLEAEDKVPLWVNDSDGRINQALDGGYEFVTSTNPVTTGEKEDATFEGNRISMRVGRNKDGSDKQAYLMAIPREWRDEDMQALEAENMKVDQAIRGGNAPGTPAHGVQPKDGGITQTNVQYKP
jgi:hypothetical protein